jgi:hypothetical protein
MNPTHQITPSDTRRHDSSPMPMMWSPTGSDTHSRSTSQNLDGRFLLEEEGYLHDSEEDSPPIIRRTFAFDEWDDDEKTGTEDHEINGGTTRSESSKSSVEKIKDRPKKNVHGMFSDDDDATVVENKKGSDDVTSDNEEARSTTSTHNTEKMTNLFQNSKFDVDENKHTAITPSATTKATGHPFPLYSYQSFGRATLSSLDTTSTTLFLNDSFDYGLSHTNNGSALLTMNSSSNNISPEVLSRPNFHPSDSHQCASIPRQAAAFYHHHQYYYDHPHEVTAKMAPSNQSNDYGNHCLQKLEYGTNTSILQDDDDDDDIFESSTSEEIPTSIPKFIMFQKKHNK